MKTVDNYSSYQLDRLVQEIEGRLNDYEGGISEKDETIKSFAFFIGECAKNAVNNALAEHDAEIIKIIDEMIENKKKQIYKSLSEYLGEANIPAGRITILNLMAENESIICDELATELKEKLK